MVPKSVGLVSPDANPSPNPWGQKSPGVGGWVALITTLRTLLSITRHGPTCPKPQNETELDRNSAHLAPWSGPHHSQILRLDLGLSSLDRHMMSWLDTPPKATKSRQVSVVPKSVGLVSPDANPSTNPWGQKSPVDPAGHPQGEGWYHTHPRGMNPDGHLYQTGARTVHLQPTTDP